MFFEPKRFLWIGDDKYIFSGPKPDLFTWRAVGDGRKGEGGPEDKVSFGRFFWFCHVFGRPGGRANGRANPPEYKPVTHPSTMVGATFELV